MDCPRNIEDSASQLYFQDKSSAEYKALLLIATLPHPLRSILATFVLAAVNREKAAQYLLDEVSTQEVPEYALSVFVGDWITLSTAIRPTLARDLNKYQKEVLRRRDGTSCCFSRPQDATKRPEDLLHAFIIPPTFFGHPEMITNPRLSPMLDMFIGKDKAKELRSVLQRDSCKPRFEQILVLGKGAFPHFHNGQLSMKAIAPSRATGNARYLISGSYLSETAPDWKATNVISLAEKSGGFPTLPNPLLLEVNHRFSKTLSWIHLSERIEEQPRKHSQSGTTILNSRLLSPFLHALRLAWRNLPKSFRSLVCERLMLVGRRFYGPTLSDRIHRLPFNLYVRVEEADWGPRHQAEFETLRLVEKSTAIPAPRPIDVFQHKEKSYLLMTRVPGQPIGTLIHSMTDMQVENATRTLAGYIAGLRAIHNTRTNTARICNSLGGGVLDWRIGDSQQRKLSFMSVAEFHQSLTAGATEELQEKADLSHSKDHDIVFTHGDLNPRNVLADQNGTITGIVDWECAGWFPEYWEHTKAHFAVRHSVRWLVDVVDQLFTGHQEELMVEDMLMEDAAYL